MTPDSALRREHLAHICRLLAAYIEAGHPVRMTTVHQDEEALAELARDLADKPAVIFAVEDWEAFRSMLEPTARD